MNEVVNATAFDPMRAQADRFVPEGGKGFGKTTLHSSTRAVSVNGGGSSMTAI